jgi:hypothetical protein
MDNTGVCSHDLKDFCDLERYHLQGGTHDMGASRATGNTDDCAASVLVTVLSSESDEGRDEVHPAAPGTSCPRILRSSRPVAGFQTRIVLSSEAVTSLPSGVTRSFPIEDVCPPGSKRRITSDAAWMEADRNRISADTVRYLRTSRIKCCRRAWLDMAPSGLWWFFLLLKNTPIGGACQGLYKETHSKHKCD